MDYDDNDFQGQNLHLTGEGSSKVSSVLRPYALPKFDFDDSLQGHLRFDSLVENEVFLGIASQEDNQWIEEFSRGSSGIEFSSSAAESCSISRRNNVWSEATSSESVEMLLKSVGQEERVLEETIIQESDAGVEHGSLTENMDPSLKQGDGKDHVLPSQTASLPGILENFSGFDASAGSELHNAKITSQSQEAEVSTIELDSNVGSGKCSLSIGEEKSDRKCDDVNQQEVDNSVNESLDTEMREGPSVSKRQRGNTDSSQNVNASVEDLSYQENPQQVSDECVGNASGITAEHSIKSKEANVDDQNLSGTSVDTCTYTVESSLHVVSKVDSVDKHSVEISTSSFEEPASLPLLRNCDSQIDESCNVRVRSTELSQGSKCEVMVASNCAENSQQPKGNMHGESPTVFIGDGSIELNAVEAGSNKPEIADCPELNIGSLVQITRVLGCPVQENVNTLGSSDQQDNSDTSMIPVVGNKQFEQGDGSGINHVTTATASTDLPAGIISNKNEIVGTNAPEVHTQDTNAEDLTLSPVLSDVMQAHVNQSSEPDDVCMEPHVSSQERQDAKLPTECSGMECEVVGTSDSHKKVESSSCSEVGEGNILVASGSECSMTTQTEPASVAAVEETKFASHDTSEGVHLLSVGTSADLDMEEQPKSPILGVSLTHLDDMEKVEVEVPSIASSLNGIQQVASVLEPISADPISEIEKGASHDWAGKVVHEIVDHCAPTLENFNANLSGHAAVTKEVVQECSSNLEGTSHSSSAKEGDAEAVGLENPKELIAERSHNVEDLKLTVDLSNNHQASVSLASPSECDANHVVQDGVSSAALDAPHCDSPTVVDSVEFSKSENDKEKVAKGDIVPPFKVSDDVEGKSQSTSPNPDENSALKGEKSFTFEVSPSAGLGETGKGWQSFPAVQACNLPKIVEVSYSKPGGGQVDSKVVPEISGHSPPAPSGVKTQVSAKGTPKRKPRQRAAGKESAKKVNRGKETTPVRQSGRIEKSCASGGIPVAGQLLQLEELKPCENVERSGTKLSGVISIPTSNLPDLNTSAPIFQQPFTDMQQVQLRAQIMVYGALIQGTPPDEPCMIAAFGQSDGGRSSWEPAWRTSLERLHGQKPQANNSDTPLQSRSELRDAGIRVPDQAIKLDSLQAKVLSSPAARANNKGTPPVVNPMIPLSSPLWNISTPSCDGLQSSSIPRSALLDYHQALSPLHPYQTPTVQNFAGHNPSWLSQGPFPGQWVASSQVSPFNVNARFSALPITEAVKLTPVKESGVPGIKHTSPIPVLHGGPSIFGGASSLPDVKKATASSGLPSGAGDSKSRKRKKVPVTEALGQISLPTQTQAASVSIPVVIGHLSKKVLGTEGHSQISLLTQSQTESVTAPVVNSLFSTSVAVSTPAHFTSKSNPVKSFSVVSPVSSSDHPRSMDQKGEKIVISEETFSKVEEARLQAEDAAGHAAAAVSHCEGIWSQLERQKNSGLVSDVEAKLASAAVSIAAAASVAKAAAAAAKIASSAAEQAKLMANEVLASNGAGSFTHSGILSFPNAVNNLEKATPASILKGGDGINRSSSIIVAAREAARRRVEAASAASKHAENLDAIVKAAELAAEAVSQAGKIVAMGDPLPLSKLVESGPEGYWKTPQSSSVQQGVTLNNVTSVLDKKNVEAAANISARSGPSNKKIQTSKHGTLLGKISGHLMEDQMDVVDGISDSMTCHEKDLEGPRAHRAFDLSKTIGVVPESEIGSSHTSVVGQNEYKNTSGSLKENSIKEGCLVEVFKDIGNIKAAWFAANVLSLKDGKAYVCYTELRPEEGSGQLKEWVPLEADSTKVPRIRIAHPMTTMQSEGTRKRRRAAVTDYAWSVGDRIDAWVQDCWREGVVIDKNKNDETLLTVQFPDQGEALVVRAWHVRPTLIWKDGEWIVWSSSKGERSLQGDLPHEKRLKVSNPTTEGKGKDKISKDVDIVESGIHQASRLLPLSAEENLFNIGKDTRDESKVDARRTMRSGLQKEGPRVIFGVPKPGKKQKFMDVSKHYVADQGNKNNVATDSVKFARYLIPQGPGPRGWKYSSKVDAKEKQGVETKSRVLKSRKPQNPSGRTLVQKDNFLTSTNSASHDAATIDNNAKNSVSDDENETGHQNAMEFGSSSNTEDATEGPSLVSSQSIPPDAPKKVNTVNARSERINKGKLAPAGGKFTRPEVKDKSIPEVVEPRRSNRRIQPTSRLLEGLQSSLTISKIPAVPHDRSQKSQSRVTSKGNANHG